MTKDHKLTMCSVCGQWGYFSHKFQAVLCDRHFFERNGKLPPASDVDTATAKAEG